jgi:type I restriction enzyme S subunit
MEEGRELPVGWAAVQLGEIAEIFSGNGFPKEHQGCSIGDIGFYKVSDISRSIAEGGPRLGNARNYISTDLAEQLKATMIPGGSTVFAKIGEAISLNRRAMAGAPCIVDNNVMAVKALEDICDFYMYYFLRSQDLRELSRATTVPSLRKSDISGLRFPVPPRSEQERIAAKLDTTLAAVDACRKRLNEVEALLKRFRQAVLAAATSGELTREWRGERGIEHEWEQTSIDQIAYVGTGSTPLRSNPSFYAATGTPWITSAATSQELILEASEFVTLEGQAAGRLRVYPEGTLLVAMYGEGKTRGQVSELGIPATINQACAAIHAPKEQYLMPFIKIALKANYLEMRSLAEGGNQPNLNLSKIKQFRIGLPPKQEVFEIIDRVESLLSLADQLEARLTAARKTVDRLTPALLAKAFRGELVPQDPGDEPASALLERIRAARQAEGAATKPSRRGRQKAAANPEPSLFDATPVTPDRLVNLLRECGALSKKALLTASELDPASFQVQLELEIKAGRIRQIWEEGEALWEAVG